MKYLQGAASRYIHGKQRTNNPTMAASFVMRRFGGGARTLREYGRRTRRTKYRRNPPLAALGAIGGVKDVLGKLPVLGGLFKTPSEKRAAAVAPGVIQAANAGNLVAVKGIMRRTTQGIQKERAVWTAALAQVKPELVQRAVKQDKTIPEADHKNPEAFAASVLSASTMYAPTGATTSSLAPFVTPQLVTAVAKGVSGGRRRSSRARYPTYRDRYGRQRYSYKPPGTEMRLPQGATAAADAPYRFFTGAVGKGGAGTTAAQLGVAAAAGAAAYLVTERVLQHLGGKAQRQEEAGVNAALAFRQARADFKKKYGRDPNRSELQEMKRAYQAQLVELGYDPVTFTRTRSRLESFLEDYNPEE